MKHFAILGVIVALGMPVTAVADGLEAKLDELVTRHKEGADAPKDFEINEEEANSYIREQSVQELPEGIESPWVKFEESLAIVGATLDLDKLQDKLPDSAIFQLLSVRVPVEITARIQAAAGIGTTVPSSVK